ncbi:hypothetical protein GWI33_005732 [Rhynchophorus ferrugineus]|uniref:Uncharacterized protein n=1 Tax=Rhynchophorus ferrugineus TaxID=354439 RepID=A0A834ME80_RHYFE|nr:hypothetical protein GWI33_005732 [Rhynchophorus ferrugineus]
MRGRREDGEKETAHGRDGRFKKKNPVLRARNRKIYSWALNCREMQTSIPGTPYVSYSLAPLLVQFSLLGSRGTTWLDETLLGVK